MRELTVKICGLTRWEDAVLAAKLGAEQLGFVFAPSPRRIEPGRARAILERLANEGLRGDVEVIGVFVNEDPSRMLEIMGTVGLDRAQLHGDETPALAADLPFPWYKALRAATIEDFDTVCTGPGCGWSCDRILVDAAVPGHYGGSGKAVPGAVARHARQRVHAAGKRFILAGGIHPENVHALLEAVRPDGIDVASGVESAPGVKDPALLRTLLGRARQYEQEM